MDLIKYWRYEISGTINCNQWGVKSISCSGGWQTMLINWLDCNWWCIVAITYVGIDKEKLGENSISPWISFLATYCVLCSCNRKEWLPEKESRRTSNGGGRKTRGSKTPALAQMARNDQILAFIPRLIVITEVSSAQFQFSVTFVAQTTGS